MKKLIYTSILWKRFFRYLLIGLSVLILTLAAQHGIFVNFQQSSPKLAIAEDTSWDGTSETFYGSFEPITDSGSQSSSQDSTPTWDGTSETFYGSFSPIVDSQPVAAAPSSSGRAPGTQAGPPAQGGPSCGDFTFRYPECDWNTRQVREVWQDSCGNYQYRNVHTEPGQCNAPSSQSSQPAQPSQPRMVNTCVGQKSWDNLVTELQLAGYNGSWDEGSAVAAYNRAACPVSQPPAPPALPQPPAPPPPAPPPAPVINNNNTNTSTNTNNNTNTNTVTVQGGVTTREVIREVVSSGNVGIGASAGQVLAVKELPKTGLPALAWAALAFIPAGFRIKRFSKVKQELIDNPSYIWENRQFKK